MIQHEITERIRLLDAAGNLTAAGYAKKLLPVYRRADIRAGKLRIKERLIVENLKETEEIRSLVLKVAGNVRIAAEGRNLGRDQFFERCHNYKGLNVGLNIQRISRMENILLSLKGLITQNTPHL